MASTKFDSTIAQHSAASKIQSAVRGFLARKNYRISQLPEKDKVSYKVLITGNDPVIEGLPQHAKEEQIALIGTSGMRSLEIACQLSSGTPKLIIIDNSKQVTEFWRKARELICKADSKESYLSSLSYYVEISKCDRQGLKVEEFKYLEELFETYGFDRLKKIISSVTVLTQSWADKDTLFKVKNILALTNIKTIYAYPSNIVAYIHEEGKIESAQDVLKNIEILNPNLAIHTDFVCGRPENVIITENHNPSYVSGQLNLDSLRSNLTCHRTLTLEFNLSTGSISAHSQFDEFHMLFLEMLFGSVSHQSEADTSFRHGNI